MENEQLCEASGWTSQPFLLSLNDDLPMIDDLLQDRSALYVAGAMSADERQHFELVLEFHHELREYIAGLEEVGAAITLSALRAGGPGPSAELKGRILRQLGAQQRTRDGIVMTGPDRLVRWMNAEFSAMCGYALDELAGRSLGPILQGAATCPLTAARMREAVHALRPCRETILNYHKSGASYWAEVEITPILDDAGQPLWFVAREREVAKPLAA
jgi:PAS domain S-box-containing protein